MDFMLLLVYLIVNISGHISYSQFTYHCSLKDLDPKVIDYCYRKLISALRQETLIVEITLK